MAVTHLTALSSPEFPQVLTDSIERIIDVVDVVLARNAPLSQCDFSDQYCDCREVATVHHLKSEHEFCARHFKAVNRG